MTKVRELKESIERLDGIIDTEKARKKAEEHWKFNERWLHMVFVDAFVHGYKHGLEAKRNRRREKIQVKEASK